MLVLKYLENGIERYKTFSNHLEINKWLEKQKNKKQKLNYLSVGKQK